MKPFLVHLITSGFVSVAVLGTPVVAQAPPNPVAGTVTVTKKREPKKVQKDGQNIAVPVKAKVQVRGGGAMFGARPANRDNMVQQYMQQARPLLRAELIFVREVCELAPAQFRRIHRDAEVAFKELITEVITKFLDAQTQQRAGVQTLQTVQALAPDATTLVRGTLASIMKKNLTPDQFSRYQAEAEKRDVFETQAAVRYLVTALDRDLYLSDSQRQRLTESLNSHWDRNWGSSLEFSLYGNQCYPAGIDPYVTPALSAAQKKIWQGQQKVGKIGGVFGMLGDFTNDFDALEPELSDERNEPKHDPKAVLNDRSKALIRKVETKNSVPQAAVSTQ